MTTLRTVLAALLAGACAFAPCGCRSSSEPAPHASPATAATALPTARERHALPAPAAPSTVESLAPFAMPSPAGAGMSKREARRIAERVMHERVGRDLSAPDYDRLADAIIRLRTASRALQAADLSTAEQAAQQQAMQSALGDVVTITGLQPSELSAAFANDEPPAR